MRERLGKVADAAGDVDVALDSVWYYGNKTEREPRVSLDDGRGPVAAVVALARQAFVAFHLAPEAVLAADEEEEHCGGWCVCARIWVCLAAGGGVWFCLV